MESPESRESRRHLLEDLAHGKRSGVPISKSVISLQPPWTPVFRGEIVNLTCNGFHLYAPEKVEWYHVSSRRRNSSETMGNILEDLVSKLVLILSVFNDIEDFGGFLKTPPLSFSSLALKTLTQNLIYFLSLELFSRPKVKITDSQPTEGNSVNLSCETQLPLERPDTRLHFVFFRDNGVLLSNWSRSPELQIAAIWKEDSGSYWCRAETVTSSVHKHSLPLEIHVQRIPVSGVLLEIQPQGDLVVEGETLVLVCSVAEGTGNITFSWHREDMEESLGKKSQRSQRAELEIPDIRESQAGSYYCAADNSYGLIQSEAVNVTVRSVPGNRGGLVAARATGGTLSTLLVAVALLFYCWHRRKPGLDSLLPFAGIHALSLPQITQLAAAPAAQLCEVLVNERPLLTQICLCFILQEMVFWETQPASTSRTSVENEHASTVYSVVKTQLWDDSAGNVSSEDEDAMEGYAGVPLVCLVPDPKPPAQ
ncbi:Fc receptor-like protein 4 [Camelus dromedarius]|uniref:Fc receptor-like protein 4 n=1 Tax=Camelus dromedarius TaxID=9838 RepID=A0A5N4CPR8_CAMDR|nr:Fc receptor-like protein 4 [Camelus dromedarius]